METERLIIDPVREADKEAYFQNISHDKKVLETFVCKYADSLDSFDFSRYPDNPAIFAIRLKETGQLIGILTLFDETQTSCEIGYGIGSRYWNMGYTTEAVRRFIRYCFEEKGFRTVYASFFTGNDASRRVMEKCGMYYDHFSEKALTYLGLERDLSYYAITCPGGQMKLIEPSMAYDAQIQAYRQEFLREGGSMDGCGSLRRFDKTQDWLSQVEALKTAETAPEGMVPVTQYIYVRESDDKIVGVIQIRHYFNEFLEKYAGHIGYSVCPSERRKGYATQMLRLVLPMCRRLGIDHVLISCVQGNEGSRRTILKNGGVYESTVYLKERDVYLERYWIDLTGYPRAT